MKQTLTITNFGGRLTRVVNGDLNSGFSKFDTSFGYDPFSKPGNLTWLEQPSSIAGITGVLTGAATRFEGTTTLVYAVSDTGNAYRIQPNNITSPNLDSILGVGSVTANSNTYKYGASIEFFGNPERMYVGGDKGINSLPMTSVVTGAFAGDAFLGTTGNYVANVARPLKPFAGELIFGNGPTIGAIGATNTVTSSVIGVPVGGSGSNQNIYSEINPPLPAGTFVHDMDVSPEYNYLMMTTSNAASEDLTTISSDRPVAAATTGDVFKWNGTDVATTAGTAVPSQSLTALQTYFQNAALFANDPFGLSVGDETQKSMMLPNNKSPVANATGVNGNFIFWAAPEVSADGTAMYGSMYYFGQLDRETPAGLFRVLRYTTPLSAGFVYQVPVNLLVNNKYRTVNNALTAITSLGWGKHYLSTIDINPSTTTYRWMRFLITPSGTGTPQLGVYETQSQLFSKRVHIDQIRVYTEPTVAGNGFQVDIIGVDGTVLTNGTFNYTFAAGSDEYSMLGALQRINFNPTADAGYGFGIRVTNTGTTNMTIKKIEVDWSQEGK